MNISAFRWHKHQQHIEAGKGFMPRLRVYCTQFPSDNSSAEVFSCIGWSFLNVIPQISPRHLRAEKQVRTIKKLIQLSKAKEPRRLCSKCLDFLRVLSHWCYVSEINEVISWEFWTMIDWTSRNCYVKMLIKMTVPGQLVWGRLITNGLRKLPWHARRFEVSLCHAKLLGRIKRL